jgi:predicted regulator of Ras-like GTPase activity (Roadblock/LC7/MglB family)
MDAAQALADLTEISTQIETAVLATRGGDVLASTFGDEAKATEMAGVALELLAAAEEVGGARAEPLAQLQAETESGSVFVVVDGDSIAAAATKPKPTVGLVFYDLKSCLRLLEGEKAAAAKGATRRRSKKKDEDGA